MSPKARRTKGDGSLYQRASDGRWVGVVDLGWVGGKRVRRSVSAPTMTEARSKLKRLRAQVDEGVIPTDVTVQAWLTHWLDTIVANELRPRTVQTYRGYASQWLVPTLGRRKLKDLKTDHVRALHATMRDAGRSDTTIRQAHMILRAALDEAVNSDRITDNVAKRVKAPRAARNPHGVLSRDETLAVLDLLAAYGDDGRWDVASRFVVALMAGLRQGEALGLRWEDVDLTPGAEQLTLRRTVQRHPGKGLVVGELKTDLSQRTVPLVGPAAHALREHRRTAPDGFVWGGKRPTDNRRDWGMWKGVLWSAGVPDKPLHAARATTASLLDFAGVSLRTIAEVLGHSQITTAWTHYVHSDEERKRAGLEAGWAALSALPSSGTLEERPGGHARSGN